MEKYAVIKLGSKQYLVHEGDLIELERQPKPLKIEVLLYSDGLKAVIGDPEVASLVKASVIEEKMGKKVRVARFKKKSRYDKVKGHRQPVSVIKIDSIGGKEKEQKDEVKKEGKKEEAAVKKSIEKKVVKKVVKAKKTVEKKPVKKLKGSK